MLSFIFGSISPKPPKLDYATARSPEIIMDEGNGTAPAVLVAAVRPEAAAGEAEVVGPLAPEHEAALAGDRVTQPAVTVAEVAEVSEVAACGGEGAEGAEHESLAGGDELALAGCTGSDSGVEGCGRALSSAGGSRSCASSVVSCGSGCGSESSSLAGGGRAPRPAPPAASAAVAVARHKRRVAVAVASPAAPLGASTPRVVPRGPHLATRERARSREKPKPPEKPRPPTPKPRARPAPADLPPLTRESPALRVKPTRTSAARCRTPNSPTDDRLARWPSVADKYATLPRRRRDGDADGSPRRGASACRAPRPPAPRARVRIYAETSSQTALTGADVEAALAGRAVRADATAAAAERTSRGVQAERGERGEVRLRRALAELEEERARRERAEAQLEEERAGRRAAEGELERNTRRLLELCGGGAGGAGGGDGLRALEEQLRAAAELAAAHRRETDRLRDTCRTLQAEAGTARALERRLAEVEAEAAEMHDFLGAEKLALHESLRDTELELASAQHELVRRRAECRQLVRLCEQRRQETLAASARAGGGGGGAAAALDALARRLRALLDSLQVACRIASDDLEDVVFYNDAYSRSDSGGARSPAEGSEAVRGGGGGGALLAAAVARAMRAAAAPSPPESRDERSEDNSADLLDSETEPCLVTDAAYEEGSGSPNPAAGLATDPSSVQVTESRRAARADASSLCIEGEVRRLQRGEDSCSSLHNLAAWSADELSPVRAAPDLYDETSERDSLQNLSAAIVQRQRSEAECSLADDEPSRARLLDKVVCVDNLLTELLKVLRVVQLQGDAATRQLDAVREKIGDTERNVAEAVSRKLQELEASAELVRQYEQTVENLTARLQAAGEVSGPDSLEEDAAGGACEGEEARARYEALDACLAALAARQRTVSSWPRLAALQARLERLAFVLLAAAAPAPPHHRTHTIDSAA